MTRFPMLIACMAAVTASAQEPAADALTAARARLQKALATMAALPSGAFTAKWGPPGAKKAPAAAAGGVAVVVMGGDGIESPNPGTATGSWDQGVLHLQFEDEQQLLLQGRRMLAKDNDREWTLRRGRQADGTSVGFVPDPQLLFDLLAKMQLAVVHHEVGTHADRPVELLTVALNADQVTELAWSGALPIGGGMAFQAAGGGAPRIVPQPPDATVDLCLVIDPSTGLLHRAHFRSYSKDVGAGAIRFVAAGGGAVLHAGGDDDEEEAEPEKAQPAGELRYEGGLPVRPRKKKSVADFVLDLEKHGKATVPALDERSRALLGK